MGNSRPNGARRLSTTVLACTLIAGACGAGSDTSDTTSSPDATTTTTVDDRQPGLEWKSCDGVECATLNVPYDYFDQPTGTFTLKISRQRALKPDERIGVLLVNPGGPGAPGSSMAKNAAYYFSREVIERFDIVAWDPRGTGASTPAVDCIDNYDEFFAEPLDSETAQRFVDACVERSGDILPHVGTANSARDIDAIRRALGEDKVSYFGFSYGGVLGVVWRSMFPETVRAMVLDAPPSATASRSERIASQAEGFEDILGEFLEKNGLVSTWNTVTGSPPAGATKQMVLTAAISALYDEASWPKLTEALESAATGDGTKIVSLYRAFYYQDEGFAEFRDTFEASIAIACVDDIQRLPLPNLETIAPRLHQFFESDELCSRWPATSQENYFFRSGTGAPTVVVGATRDAASPFIGVQATASVAGNVRLIAVDASRHTSYLGVDCVTSLVDDYLIGLVAPPNSTCQDGESTHDE